MNAKTEAQEKPKAGRRPAANPDAEPGVALGRMIVEQRKSTERLAQSIERTLGEGEGVKFRRTIDEGALKPRVEKLARKLNQLGDAEFALIEGLVEGQIEGIAKLKEIRASAS